MRIVLSGGGTGGHLTPVLAVARQLRKLRPNADICFIGQGDELAHELSALDINSYHVLAGKWRRYHNQSVIKHLLDLKTTWLNLVDVFKFAIGLLQSLWRLLALRPDVVFTKGGFASLPVGLAAAALRKKLIIHESDVTPGLTNRVLSRFADVIAIGFAAEKYPQWQSRELIHVGNPIRLELLDASKEEGVDKFSLDPKLPTLLVLGGSSGARSINDAVIDQIPKLAAHCQVLHVVGRRDWPRIKNLYEALEAPIKDRYQVFDYLTGKLGAAIRAADLVLTRGGANSLSELAAFAKASIVVPSPYLAGGHQLHNASVLTKDGAVLELHQDRLGELASTVLSTIEDSSKLDRLQTRIADFAKLDAAEILAKKVVQLAEGE